MSVAKRGEGIISPFLAECRSGVSHGRFRGCLTVHCCGSSDIAFRYISSAACTTSPFLRGFLIQQFEQERTVVLMIDEAQTISRANLDLLQMLSNEQTAKVKLVQIVMLAQPNFVNKLAQKPALRSRITGGASLNPLTYQDAVEMLRYRVSVAGGDFETLFSSEVQKPLYNATSGIPREMCVLCDAALVNAFALRRKSVDLECLQAAVVDLSFKGFRVQSAV